MSVIKSKRGESAMQFIETARQLEIYTIKQCAKFPKRYMFLLTKDIVSLSSEIYNAVKAANSIYPTNATEVQLRTNYIITANCRLQSLISQIDIAREFIRTTDANKAIKNTVWRTWADLMSSEAKLLAALRRSDKERYKNI